jgi:hypothetical protein
MSGRVLAALISYLDRVNRGALPAHQPRVEMLVDVESTIWRRLLRSTASLAPRPTERPAQDNRGSMLH